MNGYPIGELARLAGIRPSTIRYYESINLLPEPMRRSGQRIYTDETLGLLRLIRWAISCGLSLREIGILFREAEQRSPSEIWHRLVRQRAIEIEQQITELQVQRSRLERARSCRCATLVQCQERLSTTFD